MPRLAERTSHRQMGGTARGEAGRQDEIRLILVADLQSLRIMRHLSGSARRLPPLRSGILLPSAVKTFPVKGAPGRAAPECPELEQALTSASVIVGSLKRCLHCHRHEPPDDHP
jgi:hypothetical protein